MWSGRRGGRSRVLRGVQRRGTWAAATASWAGVRQRGGATCTWAYNTRFLILPWVEVPHLASHLLAGMAKRLSEDWEYLYQHLIYFLETFVDPTRFRGTCYRAANWIRFSYGFRPKHSQHDALEALMVGIQRRKVNWILDADYRSFLDLASYCPQIHEVLSNRFG